MLHEIYILTHSGKILFQRKIGGAPTEGGEEQKILVSAFFTALSSFAKTVMNSDLRELVLSNMKALFVRGDFVFSILMIDQNDVSSQFTSMHERICASFEGMFNLDIWDGQDMQAFRSFNLMLNEFLEELKPEIRAAQLAREWSANLQLGD